MDTKPLSQELDNLQKHVIGLFKPRHSGAQLELVIKNDDGLLKTITLGGLGGMTTTHINKDRGTYIEFGDGKTLADMKKDPFGLDAFCKQFGPFYQSTPMPKERTVDGD